LYLFKISALENHIIEIKALLGKNNFPEPSDIIELPSSGGSQRIYFRIFFNKNERDSLLAAFNPDVNENIPWFSYSVHFRNKGLNVPEIYGKDESYRYFLLQDLGDKTLFNILDKESTDSIRKYYKEALRNLLKFQIYGYDGLDLNVSYPVKDFNKRSVFWDLNYFKYYFAKPNKIIFDENQLENEFETLSQFLLKPKKDYFLYRDFQSRNIIIHNNDLWFIDFQGGRRGPLQYDLVSLLYQAKANLSDDFREEMHQFYLEELEKVIPGLSGEFDPYYIYFIYFRLMQVLGAYGFRGIIQRKGHFLKSIPPAIQNLENLLQQSPLSEDFKTLNGIFDQIVGMKNEFDFTSNDKLTISISSFSYKKQGYPFDHSENGGGFVFDCRALPNPGRIAELKDYSGFDQAVIDYLSSKQEVSDFLQHAFRLIDQSIENYLERGFTSLSVNFGCTGGKHRSVYSAEKLKMHLNHFGNRLKVNLKHLQLDD
jgi:aminoglycoside/choline kinase family phosphotransferase